MKKEVIIAGLVGVAVGFYLGKFMDSKKIGEKKSNAAGKYKAGDIVGGQVLGADNIWKDLPKR